MKSIKTRLNTKKRSIDELKNNLEIKVEDSQVLKEINKKCRISGVLERRKKSI